MICWRGSLTTLHASATWSVCAGRRASRAVLRHGRRRVVADGRRRAPLQGVPDGDVGDVGKDPGRDTDAAGQSGSQRVVRRQPAGRQRGGPAPVLWFGSYQTAWAAGQSCAARCARPDRDLNTAQGQRHAAKPIGQTGQSRGSPPTQRSRSGPSSAVVQVIPSHGPSSWLLRERGTTTRPREGRNRRGEVE